MESTETQIMHLFEAAWLTNPAQFLLPEDVMWFTSPFYGDRIEGVLDRLITLQYEGRITRHVGDGTGGYRLHPNQDPLRRVTPAGGAGLRVEGGGACQG